MVFQLWIDWTIHTFHFLKKTSSYISQGVVPQVRSALITSLTSHHRKDSSLEQVFGIVFVGCYCFWKVLQLVSTGYGSEVNPERYALRKGRWCRHHHKWKGGFLGYHENICCVIFQHGYLQYWLFHKKICFLVSTKFRWASNQIVVSNDLENAVKFLCERAGLV